MGLIVRIRIKNASKCNFRLKILKKGVQIGPKFKCELGTQESDLALLECWSALPKCRLAQMETQAEDFLIEINLTFFNFLEIWMRPNSYMIIQLIFRSIPTSINRGNKSKLEALLLWLFNSPYVKDVLEAFALGISFL